MENGTANRRLWWLIVLMLALLNVGVWQRPRLAKWVASIAMVRASQDAPSATRWIKLSQILWRQAPESALAAARLARRSSSWESFDRELRRARFMGIEKDLADREQWLALAQNGQMSEVKSKLGQLIETPNGDEPQICEAYAQGYMRMRDFASALSLLEAWSKDFPRDARPHAWMGQIKAEIHAQEEAESSFRTALKLDKNNSQAALGLAMLLMDLKRPNESIEYFEIALNSERLGAEAAAGLANARKSLSQSEVADRVLANALERYPNDYRLLAAKATMLVEDGKYEEAERLLHDEIVLGTNRRELRQTYGTALRGIGRREEAAKHFQYASEAAEKTAEANRWIADLQEDNQNLDLRFKIGDTFLRYGNTEDGLLWLQSVLELAPNHRGAHSSLADYYQMQSRRNPKYIKRARMHAAASRS